MLIRETWIASCDCQNAYFVAASTGAVRDALWFGELKLTGFIFHPFVLSFALSGTLMISRMRIPKP